MKRHRAIANEERLLRGLCGLPLGPRYSPSTADAIRRRYEELSHGAGGHEHGSIQSAGRTHGVMELHTPDRLRNGEMSGENGVGLLQETCSSRADDLNTPLEMCSPAVQLDASSTFTSNLQSGEHDSEGELIFPTSSDVVLESCVNDEEENNDRMIITPENGDGGMDWNSVSSADSISAGGYTAMLPSIQAGSSDEDSVANITNFQENGDSASSFSGLSCRDDGFQAEYGAPKARFLLWCQDNKKWLSFAVDMAVSGAVMEKILQNLGAPYQKCETVKNNLIKYSGLETEKFLVCREHMLFDARFCRESLQTAIESEDYCPLCVQSKRTPEFCYFEYFNLLSRIRDWIGEESSCRDTFDYVQKVLADANGADGNGSNTMFRDFTDGKLYKKIVEKYGGKDATKFDIFIAPSTDGFDPYSNRSYDTWPVLAMNLNLSPEQRFLCRNAIVLGFVRGPKAPKKIDSFFIPLLKEVQRINENGGTALRFYNGSVHKVRVHVIWFSVDLQAQAKLTGTAGVSGRKPCLQCKVEGVWCAAAKHYYFPCQISVAGQNNSRFSRMIKRIDAAKPPMRSVARNRAQLYALRGDTLSVRERNTICRDTGMKWRTLVFDFPDIMPFHSFPIDTMHLIMNIVRDLMELLKGENKHVLRLSQNDEDYIISDDDWKRVDAEIVALGYGTCQSAFGPKPRDTNHYRCWKAIECREFIVTYALIVLDGLLPHRYMLCLKHFSSLCELVCRPSFSGTDLDRIEELSVDFVKAYEKEFFRYRPDRVGLCKFTIHLVLHIRHTIENVGPLVNCSRLYVERYIGFIKRRLHSPATAAQSLSENAKFFEAYKLMYGEHFERSRDCRDEESSVLNDMPTGSLEPLGDETSTHSDAVQNQISADERGSDGNSGSPQGDAFDESSFVLHGVGRQETFASPFAKNVKLREHLHSYISGVEGISEQEAISAVSNEWYLCYRNAMFKCGETWQRIGSMIDGHASRERSDYYIAGLFVPEQANAHFDYEVHYGRVLRIIEYTFDLPTGGFAVPIIVSEWAENLYCTPLDQIYINAGLKASFRSLSVIGAASLLNVVGVVEHTYPRGRRFSRLSGTKTFIMDPFLRLNNLLSATQLSPDGANRVLQVRNSRRRVDGTG